MPYLAHYTLKDTGMGKRTLNPKDPETYSALYFGLELSDTLRAKIPHTLRLETKKSREIDGIIALGDASYSICRELKEELERLEPGVHEFFPVKVVRDRDDLEFGTHFLCHLTQAIDCLLYEKTWFDGPDYGGYGFAMAEKSGHRLFRTLGDQFPCVLRADRIKGAHLWRGKVPDKRYYRQYEGQRPFDPMATKYFVSDELYRFIRERKIVGWDFYECSAE